jgi:branched-chain amino acid transport system permease protein
MGVKLNAASADSWIIAGMVFLTGVVLFEITRRAFNRDWNVIQEDIEKEIKRREAAI